MNLNERTLSVLSCKYVGDVVIDPPWTMTREMIAALGISIVAHGSIDDSAPEEADAGDPYQVAKSAGIFTTIPSRNTLSVDNIVERLQANQERMEAKVKRKMAAEKEYYENRYGFATDSEPIG